MRILQFGFSSDAKNCDLPHNYHRNVVVYTGTHDNDTAIGWFNSVAGEGSTRDSKQIEKERQFCLEYLNTDGREINWDFIRTVLASVANTAIVPLQDLLGLGSEARMNLRNTLRELVLALPQERAHGSACEAAEKSDGVIRKRVVS